PCGLLGYGGDRSGRTGIVRRGGKQKKLASGVKRFTLRAISSRKVLVGKRDVDLIASVWFVFR
ncbi:MAG TPA: hypothetical protein PLD40_07415, partial [Kiritimatiellia bacterium]|nr:hypothetical protein [Kiritimatiellia bacterium]